MKVAKSRTSLLAFLLALAAGCSPQGLQSLEGKVSYQGGGFVFAGDTIELRSAANTSLRAFGEIKPDGTFKVDTLENGKVVTGAKPGTYEARIVISDDDYEHKKLAAKSINKKYLRFEASGLSVTVPSSAVTLTISK